MNQHEIQTESVEGLIAIRANIDRELASRKATLQKQLAQLGGIRPTRAPRSDKGQKRAKADPFANLVPHVEMQADAINADKD